MKTYKNALKLVLLASLGAGLLQGAQAATAKVAAPDERVGSVYIIPVEGRPPSNGKPTKTIGYDMCAFHTHNQCHYQPVKLPWRLKI